VLEATNPCGEQWLPPYGSCNLGSIALHHFASWPEGGKLRGSFDWERFRQAIVLGTEFLDDVIDANGYVPEVPGLEECAMGERRIGLSCMGLADAMAIMGIRYGSQEGVEFVGQISEFFRYWAMHTSTLRAEKRGPFEWIEDSIYDPELLKSRGEGAEVAEVITMEGKPLKLWKRPEPLRPYEYNFGRPDLDWEIIYNGLCEYGIRNACTTTWVPTGTTSNVADCEGSGIECFFALTFVRQLFQAAEGVKLNYASGLFREALVRAGLEDDVIQAVVDEIASSGSCQGHPMVPAWVQHAFVVAADLSPEEHIWMQAGAQAFVDNAISKTINMPNDATVQDVADAYKLAFDLGCKGITVYRQGSREVEVLTVGKQDAVEVVTAQDWPVILPLEIPPVAKVEGLPARVIPVATAFGNVQVTITEHPDHPGRPFDVRLGIGKAGNDKNADVEALGRMISGNTRAGVAVEWIVEQLEDIGGRSISGFGNGKVLSVADGVAKTLKRLYLDTPEAQPMTETLAEIKAEREKVDPAMVCPNCHNATVVVEAGCRHCSTMLGGCGEFNGCD
jgi:ribonucleoside-diphosphate reductase alpha chain